ncbi:hypothetical protein LTS18_006719, partial [Coniosporium uncinatum]
PDPHGPITITATVTNRPEPSNGADPTTDFFTVTATVSDVPDPAEDITITVTVTTTIGPIGGADPTTDFVTLTATVSNPAGPWVANPTKVITVTEGWRFPGPITDSDPVASADPESVIIVTDTLINTVTVGPDATSSADPVASADPTRIVTITSSATHLPPKPTATLAPPPAPPSAGEPNFWERFRRWCTRWTQWFRSYTESKKPEPKKPSTNSKVVGSFGRPSGNFGNFRTFENEHEKSPQNVAEPEKSGKSKGWRLF